MHINFLSGNFYYYCVFVSFFYFLFLSLQLHVSKKSRVVDKYKGGFLGIDLSLLWKATKLRAVILRTVRKRFS